MDKDKEKRRGGLVATGKKRSNKHKKKPGPGDPSNGASPGVGHELNLQLHVRRSLCRGIARLLAGVSASHLLQHQEAEAIFEYSSWRCRFEHRFAAFANLQQPPVLRFGEFENTMSGDPQALLASAAECFKQCKSLIDRAVRAMPEPDETALAELRNLTKVAVANGVTIAQFQAGAPRRGRRRIEPTTTRTLLPGSSHERGRAMAARFPVWCAAVRRNRGLEKQRRGVHHPVPPLPR